MSISFSFAHAATGSTKMLQQLYTGAAMPNPQLRTQVLRASRGYADAVGAFYDATIERVHVYIGLQVEEESVAQQLVTSTYGVAAFTWSDCLKLGVTPEAWVLRIARGECREGLDSTFRIVGFNPDPERNARLQVIKRQSPTVQECMALRYFAGLGRRIIAETLGLTQEAVDDHLLYGLEELREYEKTA